MIIETIGVLFFMTVLCFCAVISAKNERGYKHVSNHLLQPAVDVARHAEPIKDAATLYGLDNSHNVSAVELIAAGKQVQEYFGDDQFKQLVSDVIIASKEISVKTAKVVKRILFAIDQTLVKLFQFWLFKALYFRRGDVFR